MTLQKGDSADDFELLDNNGNSVILSSFKGSKNVVLCFYPKNHLFACPSKKVFEMAKSVISVYSEIVSTDTVLFAISVDSVDSQDEFVKEYDSNTFSELDIIPINEDLKTYLKGVENE